LIRNLFHQWNSYAGQANFGNAFFLQTLHQSLNLDAKDPFVAYLAQSFTHEERNDFDIWIGQRNFDKVFCYFVGFHLYFLLVTRRSADLVMDVNQLARQGRQHQVEVAAQIHALTGLNVDLTDAREAVDFPLHPVQSPQDCQSVIRTFADKALAMLSATQEERAFIDRLIDEMWEEQRRFALYTGSVPEMIARCQTSAQPAGHVALSEDIAALLAGTGSGA
jgi:hypothetical protein